MGWRDQYKSASFRGVPFNFESGDDKRTQRLAVHKFPGISKARLEEMGGDPIPFTIEAFVLGDDYLTLRNNLQAACVKTGVGKLVHPFYGELTVKCQEIITRHTGSEMGIARFSLTFLEDGGLTPFQTAIDTQVKVRHSAEFTLEMQKTAFERAFDYASLPYGKAQQVVEQVNKATEDVGKARALVGQASAFAHAVGNIGGAVSVLLLDSLELAKSFINVITFGFLTEDQDNNAVPDIRQSFSGLSALYQYSPAIAVESDAADAFNQLIRGASIAQGAHLLSVIEFDSVDEATVLRDVLFAAIDAFLSLEGLDDDLYLAVMTLRSSVEKDISERAVVLPRLVNLVLPEFTPALVLSYRLYGELSQEESILRRNKIANPGLVPGGIPVKIITDV